MNELMTIYYVNSEELVADALVVRRKVFIEGQGVLESRDIDGLDAGATHYVGYIEEEPVAVARTRDIYLGTDNVGSADIKIERVGVVSEYRGKNIGADVMTFILSTLKGRLTTRNAVLESQIHAIEFYKRLGFTPVGKEFIDAGIPHIKMTKSITPKPMLLNQHWPRKT